VLADLLTFFSSSYMALHDGFLGAPVHDVAAVLALTHPDLFERRPMHVVVETSGQHTRGMTLIDQRPRNDVPAPNTDVLWAVDADAVFEVITAAI
jgi:inosine-uridine nucleoside N-ribohydrolase